MEHVIDNWPMHKLNGLDAGNLSPRHIDIWFGIWLVGRTGNKLLLFKNIYRAGFEI